MSALPETTQPTAPADGAKLRTGRLKATRANRLALDKAQQRAIKQRVRDGLVDLRSLPDADQELLVRDLEAEPARAVSAGFHGWIAMHYHWLRSCDMPEWPAKEMVAQEWSISESRVSDYASSMRTAALERVGTFAMPGVGSRSDIDHLLAQYAAAFRALGQQASPDWRPRPDAPDPVVPDWRP